MKTKTTWPFYLNFFFLLFTLILINAHTFASLSSGLDGECDIEQDDELFFVEEEGNIPSSDSDNSEPSTPRENKGKSLWKDIKKNIVIISDEKLNSLPIEIKIDYERNYYHLKNYVQKLYKKCEKAQGEIELKLQMIHLYPDKLYRSDLANLVKYTCKCNDTGKQIVIYPKDFEHTFYDLGEFQKSCDENIPEEMLTLLTTGKLGDCSNPSFVIDPDLMKTLSKNNVETFKLLDKYTSDTKLNFPPKDPKEKKALFKAFWDLGIDFKTTHENLRNIFQENFPEPDVKKLFMEYQEGYLKSARIRKVAGFGARKQKYNLQLQSDYLQKFNITFKDGVLYQNAKPFTTETARSFTQASLFSLDQEKMEKDKDYYSNLNGVGIWVLVQNKKTGIKHLRIANIQMMNLLHHSSYVNSKEEDLLGAGEVSATQMKIQGQTKSNMGLVNLQSGHYLPGQSGMRNLVEFLNFNRMDLSHINIEFYQRSLD